MYIHRVYYRCCESIRYQYQFHYDESVKKKYSFRQNKRISSRLEELPHLGLSEELFLENCLFWSITDISTKISLAKS